jgi:hypothetical protein
MGGGGGGGDEWECGGGTGMMGGGTMCPTVQPANGVTCTEGEECPYTTDGKMVTCSCAGGKFVCGDAG